jgi:hypothetical protein
MSLLNWYFNELYFTPEDFTFEVSRLRDESFNLALLHSPLATKLQEIITGSVSTPTLSAVRDASVVREDQYGKLQLQFYRGNKSEDRDTREYYNRKFGHWFPLYGLVKPWHSTYRVVFYYDLIGRRRSKNRLPSGNYMATVRVEAVLERGTLVLSKISLLFEKGYREDFEVPDGWLKALDVHLYSTSSTSQIKTFRI